MPELRVQMFGQLQIYVDEQVWPGPENGKARELFCFLLLHPAIVHTREHLATLLWNDCINGQARKYLRQALWQLQTACETHFGAASCQFLTVTPEVVRINQNFAIRTDVEAFRQASHWVSRGEVLDQENARHLQQGLALYQGDLLEGWYQDWCLYEREQLQNLYLNSLDKMLGYCVTQQDYALGLGYGERLLKHDPARERTHQQLMRLQYFCGDRTAALRQFKRCETALRQELGVNPTKRTQELYAQIRADQLEPEPASLSAPPFPASVSDSLPSLLDHLNQAYTLLARLQNEIQQDIQLVERCLPASKRSK